MNICCTFPVYYPCHKVVSNIITGFNLYARLGKNSINKTQLLWQSQSKKIEFGIFQILRDKILTNMVYCQAMVFIQTYEKISCILLSLTLRDALPRASRHYCHNSYCRKSYFNKTNFLKLVLRYWIVFYTKVLHILRQFRCLISW